MAKASAWAVGPTAAQSSSATRRLVTDLHPRPWRDAGVVLVVGVRVGIDKQADACESKPNAVRRVDGVLATVAVKRSPSRAHRHRHRHRRRHRRVDGFTVQSPCFTRVTLRDRLRHPEPRRLSMRLCVACSWLSVLFIASPRNDAYVKKNASAGLVKPVLFSGNPLPMRYARLSCFSGHVHWLCASRIGFKTGEGGGLAKSRQPKAFASPQTLGVGKQINQSVATILI